MSERQSASAATLLELTIAESAVPSRMQSHLEPSAGSLRRSSRKPRPAPSASLVDHVFKWLASRIMSGTLRPGEALSELAIVERVGASRTPVREALRRLERDGLVKIVPGRGAFVADVTEREVREIYLCREYLTGLSSRLAAENVTREALAQFQAINARLAEAVADGDLPRFFRYNVEFGRVRNDLANNPTLSTLSASLGLRVMRLRYLSMGLPTRMEISLRKHQEIVAAFERRDGAAAEAVTRELIHGACLAILRYHFGVDEHGTPVDLTEISDLITDGA